MIIDDTLYDLSMTLVIAKVTDDAVVISSDGMGRSLKTNKVMGLSFKKIFPLGNGVFWAVAASGVAEDELQHLADYATAMIVCDPPYTIQLIAMKFAMTAKFFFRSKNSTFKADFILCGFGRDAENMPVSPLVVSISTSVDYGMAESDGFAMGSIGDYDPQNLATPNDTTGAVKAMRKAISEVSKVESTVGGDIKTVIIKDMGKKQFKELIKKASQPAPKGVGK